MARKRSHITITDKFCGAGGSGQGAKKSLEKVGGELVLALNHWKLATETYSTNFPNTLVDCTDVSACDPRRYPSTDGLITSPECTTHSPAGGNNHKTLKKQMDMFNSGTIDPSTERSRATMWDVCRFAEYHEYNFIVVENVVEAKTRWVLFDDWLRSMHTLGYNHRCVYHNSMHHHPTPQSRDRMYIVFWKKGNKAPNLDYTPSAHCSQCNRDVLSVQSWKRKDVQYGKFRQQYVYCCPNCTNIVEPYYYASFNCIDWSDIGTRIGDRKKPLVPKTMERIEFGRKKFANNPFLVLTSYSKNARGITRSMIDSLYSQTTTNGQAIIQQPFIIKLEHFNPFIIKGEHSKGTARAITDTLNIITSGGIKNGLVTNEAWQGFISQYYSGSDCVKHFTEEAGTFTTGDRSALTMFKEPSIEDCYYRMLKPQEVKVGMAFDTDYKILGNSRDQVKQCGNAVTPPVMEWLVDRCIESLN